MDAQMFGRLAHQRLGERTRRAIFGRIAALALAGPLGLGAAHGDADSKKKRKHKHKNAKNVCAKQKSQCAAAIAVHCAQVLDPAVCEGVYLPCCEHFTGCNVEAGIACIFAAD